MLNRNIATLNLLQHLADVLHVAAPPPEEGSAADLLQKNCGFAGLQEADGSGLQHSAAQLDYLTGFIQTQMSVVNAIN